MRPIIIEHTGYDSFNGENWTDVEAGFVLTQHIVLYTDHEGFGFRCFDEAIADEQSTVNASESKIIKFNVSGASVSKIELAELADMSLITLAEVLAKQ